MLARERRLRSGRDWDDLFRSGFSVAGPLLSLRVAATPGKRRVGFSVGRKLGGAVTRNLVKRRLRAVTAERWDSLPDADIGVLARPAAAQADYEALKAAFDGLTERARRRLMPEAD